MAIARSQWNGLLYFDDENGVYLPTQNIRATLIGGAKLNKLGMAIKRGTVMLSDREPLDYGKKLSKDKLWEQGYIDKRSVVISNSKVMAYRPKFKDWNVTFELIYDENTLDESDIMLSFENAGRFIGIGGYRPEKGGIFGRFDTEKVA